MALGLIDLTGKRKKKTHLRVKNHFHYAEDFEFNFWTMVEWNMERHSIEGFHWMKGIQWSLE